MQCPDAKQLLACVRPGLALGDVNKIAEDVVNNLTAAQVCGLLGNENVDVRRVSALVIGLVGNRDHEGCLVRALLDEDEQVNHMATHSLDAIWLRAGKPEAAEPFRRGVELSCRGSYDAAIEAFREAQLADSEYASAYYQCGLAHLMCDDFDEAIDDFRETIKRVPTHYNAIAGLGQCYLEMRQFRGAMESFKRALAINPRMECIKRMASQIEERMATQSGAGD